MCDDEEGSSREGQTAVNEWTVGMSGSDSGQKTFREQSWFPEESCKANARRDGYRPRYMRQGRDTPETDEGRRREKPNSAQGGLCTLRERTGLNLRAMQRIENEETNSRLRVVRYHGRLFGTIRRHLRLFPALTIKSVRLPTTSSHHLPPLAER